MAKRKLSKKKRSSSSKQPSSKKKSRTSKRPSKKQNHKVFYLILVTVALLLFALFYLQPDPTDFENSSPGHSVESAQDDPVSQVFGDLEQVERLAQQQSKSDKSIYMKMEKLSGSEMRVYFEKGMTTDDSFVKNQAILIAKAWAVYDKSVNQRLVVHLHNSAGKELVEAVYTSGKGVVVEMK